LGHCGEYITRKKAKVLRWELIPGPVMPCESSVDGKVKEKNAPKISQDKPEAGCEDGKSRIYEKSAKQQSELTVSTTKFDDIQIVVDEEPQVGIEAEGG
jgi:hypothetical protein